MSHIDIQVNGYAGIDFNGELLTPEQLHHIADKLEAGQVRAILPTIITDDIDRMAARLSNLQKLIAADRRLENLMPSFHIEGPCISPIDGYRGAHPAEHVRPATVDVMKKLVDAAGGPDWVSIVTLAPEVDEGLKATRWLKERKITISAGHTDAPLDLLQEAQRAGLAMFTHLGNGCANEIPRKDNIINRALSLDRLTYSFIPDGHHIEWFVLKIWLKVAGIDRSVFTTDCMSAADAPPGRYRIGPWELEVGADKLVRPPGGKHLAGSALTMREAFANAREQLKLSHDDAEQLCNFNPAKFVKGLRSQYS